MIERLLMLLAIVITIGWIVFPFIVLRNLRELIDSIQRCEIHLNAMRKYYEPEEKRPITNTPRLARRDG